MGKKEPIKFKVDPNHKVAIQFIFHFYRMSIGFSRGPRVAVLDSKSREGVALVTTKQ